MTDEHPGSKPTAVITVKVHPVDVPGQVILSIEISGSADISNPEAAITLRQAADILTTGS